MFSPRGPWGRVLANDHCCAMASHTANPIQQNSIGSEPSVYRANGHSVGITAVVPDFLPAQVAHKEWLVFQKKNRKIMREALPIPGRFFDGYIYLVSPKFKCSQGAKGDLFCFLFRRAACLVFSIASSCLVCMLTSGLLPPRNAVLRVL